MYSDESITIWKNWGGKRPLSRPICDFDGSKCPIPFVQQYFGIVIAVVFIVAAMICGALCLAYYIYRLKANEKKKMDKLWQIPFISLVRKEEKDSVGFYRV